MEIVIGENKKGTLKISQIVLKKFIHKILVTDNYHLSLNDIEVVELENDNVTVEIKMFVSPTIDLVNLKSKLNKMILNRVQTVLNLNLLNIHLIFMNKTKEVEITNGKSKNIDTTR